MSWHSSNNWPGLRTRGRERPRPRAPCYQVVGRHWHCHLLLNVVVNRSFQVDISAKRKAMQQSLEMVSKLAYTHSLAFCIAEDVSSSAHSSEWPQAQSMVGGWARNEGFQYWPFGGAWVLGLRLLQPVILQLSDHFYYCLVLPDLCNRLVLFGSSALPHNSPCKKPFTQPSTLERTLCLTGSTCKGPVGFLFSCSLCIIPKRAPSVPV